MFVPYNNPKEWPMTTTPKYELNKDWIRRGRRKYIRQPMTMDKMQANAAENDRVMAEASGLQGSQRSTARSRTFRESATMMFREAMGEVLAGGEVIGMQGPSCTIQRRRSTSQAGRRITSHVGPSGTAHQQGETLQPARRSTSQLGGMSTYDAGSSGIAHQAKADPSGTTHQEVVQPTRMSTSSWGSCALMGLYFRMSCKTK